MPVPAVLFAIPAGYVVFILAILLPFWLLSPVLKFLPTLLIGLMFCLVFLVSVPVILMVWRAFSILSSWLIRSLLERDFSVSRRELSNEAPEEQHIFRDWISFFAGDGNPNKGIEDWKWSLIANTIWKNGDAITAEQLAPYTRATPDNEGGVLPVLVHFNGRPMATEKGHIVYVFPELRSRFTDADILPGIPAFLKEKYWRFCRVQPDSLEFIVFLSDS